MLGLGLSIPRCAVRAGDALTREVAALFSAGEQGVWYDFSDFSTMFQDAAGTTPVTAVGQAVGRILDKSGRGNHATQTTDTKRPVLQRDANGKYYLLFDGIDDTLQTASINFTGTDKVTIWAGVRKLSDAASGALIELSIDAATNRAFNIFAPSRFLGDFSYRVRSTGSLSSDLTITGIPAPVTNLVTAIGDISNDILRLRVNGIQVAENTVDQGTGNYGDYPLFIGSRGDTLHRFNGRLYSLIIRGAQSTDTQITSTENYVNSKTQAY